MAPPTVVLSRDAVDIPKDCPVVRIVQNECDFNKATGLFHCTPLVREFRACETLGKIIHYEITNTAPSREIADATKEMLSMSK